MELPSLSVVIPTRNRGARLLPVLKAVLADADVAELVVVDDVSDDDTPTVLRQLTAAHGGRVVVVEGPGKGSMAAREEGIRAARGEVVLLLDDDVLPEAGLAGGHARHHAGRRKLVVVGYMPVRREAGHSADETATRLYAAEYESHMRRYEADSGEILLKLWTGNVSLRRDEALALPPGPEYPARYHVDRVWGLRLRRAGFQAVFDRSLGATHLHRRPLPALLRDAQHQGAGRVLLHRLFPEELGALAEDEFVRGLPRPARALVRAGAKSRVYAPLSTAAMRIAHLLGRARMRRSQTVVVKLLRRLGQQHGAEEVGAQAARRSAR